ncbi:Probable type I restriction enzyme BthVORF4518P M protein [Anaerobiospirillum thomasii]|uniref:type I restriction-modification system subunit M n=1 Tax=Anaerobiospirillum thomasii TaxID=179995 RepID=UPI000D963828|nr:type I restriction-modification system subunit M [Anaerobiospirillum thomasii]SPT71819.1 Probable type I restriction enzyme BthVORF4518P M protein [Anaerobiospirillum thomasii]
MSDSTNLLPVLWSCADVLRGKMDANEYKNYLLGLVFFKYLSDSYLCKVYDFVENSKPESMEKALEVYVQAYNDSDAADLLSELKDSCHYTLEPDLTFTSILRSVNENTFTREVLKRAFNKIQESDSLFNHLFDDVDLYSSKLGASDHKQSATIAELIKVLADADLINTRGDVLGNAYEYLIGQFASETGKKAGEFYTPHGPAQILCKIAMLGQEDKKGLQVYDPCMGSGSLLLSCKNYSNHPDFIKYYGQELMTSTFNLARMNMFLHSVLPENQHLRNGDTLDADWPTDEETEFDLVTMNPPYSSKWSADPGFKTDERFMDYGGALAPKSKADYAFLLHGFYHLKQTGTMAIVLPHGVLFRGAAEGTIREILLKKGAIYAVIGLPANMFFNTSIPTCIIVLKKHREGRDVLFIDASDLFSKEKKQNVMHDEHINQVIELYKNRTNVDKRAYLASFEDIEANDFNLNIPRYIDNSEEEDPIDIVELTTSITETDYAIKEATNELMAMIDDLDDSTPEAKCAIESLRKIFAGV